MKVEIRKTISGTEYWDTKAKRTLFVPAGKKPDFEVTKDPVTIIGGVDLASGKDMTVVNGINLDDMNKEQLLEFAEKNAIDVPGNMSKEDTIREYITKKLADE